MADNAQDEQRLALFIDFENIAIGVRDAHYRKFNVNLVLERLLDKGKLLSKKAYADWSRYSDYKRAFHEAAIELIEVEYEMLPAVFDPIAAMQPGAPVIHDEPDAIGDNGGVYYRRQQPVLSD